MSNYKELLDYVLDGDVSGVENEVKALIEKDIKSVSIIQEGLLPAMNIANDKYSKGEFFIPEVLVAAEALQAGMAIAKSHINTEDIPNLGTIVVGVVKGDIHDLGKNFVAMMLETAGFNVIDLGVDVSEEKFIAAAKENNAQIVGISAMVSTTMMNIEMTVKACKEAELSVKYMVGGAPLTEEFAEKIGAVYAHNGGAAVEKAKELIG